MEKRTFPYKTALSKANKDKIKWGVQNSPIKIKWRFLTTSFSSKFSLKIQYKMSIIPNISQKSE